MGSYVLMSCDSRISSDCEDDDPPEGRTLAEAKHAARRAGWSVDRRGDGAVCGPCAKVMPKL